MVVQVNLEVDVRVKIGPEAAEVRFVRVQCRHHVFRSKSAKVFRQNAADPFLLARVRLDECCLHVAWKHLFKVFLSCWEPEPQNGLSEAADGFDMHPSDEDEWIYGLAFIVEFIVELLALSFETLFQLQMIHFALLVVDVVTNGITALTADVGNFIFEPLKYQKLK